MWQWDSNLLAKVLRCWLHVEEDNNEKKMGRASMLVKGGTHGALWL